MSLLIVHKAELSQVFSGNITPQVFSPNQKKTLKTEFSLKNLARVLSRRELPEVTKDLKNGKINDLTKSLKSEKSQKSLKLNKDLRISKISIHQLFRNSESGVKNSSSSSSLTEVNKPVANSINHTERKKKIDIAHELLKNYDPKDPNVWKAFINSPKKHPEYPVLFYPQMKKIFPQASDKQIENIFKKLMEATVFELSFEDDLMLTNKNPEDKEAIDQYRQAKETLQNARDEKIPKSISELADKQAAFKTIEEAKKKAHVHKDFDLRNVRNNENFVKEPSLSASQLYANTRQIIGKRTLNPYYQEVMFMLQALDKENVRFKGNSKLSGASLWTGGKEVMEYASKNYRMLERSNIGRLFDDLKMHPDWQIQYPLWNLLSEGFVEAEIMDQIRDKIKQYATSFKSLEKTESIPIKLVYHFRADDPYSIGQLIELPTALTRINISDFFREESKNISQNKYDAYELENFIKNSLVLELQMIPLVTDSKASGGMKEAGSPLELKMTPQDFKNKLAEGGNILREGLKAIDEKLSLDGLINLMDKGKAVENGQEKLENFKKSLSPDEMLVMDNRYALRAADWDKYAPLLELLQKIKY